jgi:aspartate aminotransferase, cytoplasmic
VGCLVFVTQSPLQAKNITSVLEQLQRAEVSNPPAFGARIASTILADPSLRKTWFVDLKGMSQRISEMRKELLSRLEELGTPGDWSHIVNQSGMFCILGLNVAQVDHLQSESALSSENRS